MSRDESPVVRSAESEDGYTYMHRAFLQAFMTRNVMTADEIGPVLASVMTAYEPERPWSAGDITQPHLTSLLQQINAKIEPYNFEIRSTRDQQTKDTLYALVNKTSDSLTQFATKFSAGEIAYIRRVLDHMFETNNTRIREVMAIKHTEASQLARLSRRNRQSQINGDVTQAGEATQAADPGISIPEADDVLATLVNDGFFQQSRAGYYSLAPRALMELRTYLKETYNESPEEADEGDDPVIRIRDCEGCREIVTFGVRCNNRDCGVRWHDACANSYYRGRSRESRACPKCQTVCSGDVYVGERADRVARHSGMGRAQPEEVDE